jgi:hypothetical protein
VTKRMRLQPRQVRVMKLMLLMQQACATNDMSD